MCAAASVRQNDVSDHGVVVGWRDWVHGFAEREGSVDRHRASGARPCQYVVDPTVKLLGRPQRSEWVLGAQHATVRVSAASRPRVEHHLRQWSQLGRVRSRVQGAPVVTSKGGDVDRVGQQHLNLKPRRGPVRQDAVVLVDPHPELAEEQPARPSPSHWRKWSSTIGWRGTPRRRARGVAWRVFALRRVAGSPLSSEHRHVVVAPREAVGPRTQHPDTEPLNNL